MAAGLTIAMLLMAEVAGAAPATAPVKPAPPQAKPAESCGPAPTASEPGEIFVCAPRPQGYRIDPDVLEASRAKRSGRPKRPERMADNSCASVGPMGCTGLGGAGINLLGAAMVLGQMATKAMRGENVGQMFVTDREPSEYELYKEAKRQREAEEAEAAAAAKAKAAPGPEAEPKP